MYPGLKRRNIIKTRQDQTESLAKVNCHLSISHNVEKTELAAMVPRRIIYSLSENNYAGH